MITELFSREDRTWLDVVDPTVDELTQLSQRYGLHPRLVADCLQPDHLPKHEVSGDVTFMIVRAYAEDAEKTATSVQATTHKLALFCGKTFLITVQRKDQPYFKAFRERCRLGDDASLQALLMEILLAAVETFHIPLEEAEDEVALLQQAVLGKRHKRAHHHERVFHTQARLTVIKRMLWHTQDAIQKLVPSSAEQQPLCQDLRERIVSLAFFADSLLDDLRNLLSLQLMLASNGTNEVMRTLTIFSVFFMPLTFIVGVYGMNFKVMPEIDWAWGYPAAWAVMLAVTFVLWAWFRKKGWMR